MSAENKLDTVYKLHKIDHYVDPIFHDILTPLTIIKGNLEVINSGMCGSKIYKRELFAIDRAEKQIERIVHSYRELTNSSELSSKFKVKTVIKVVLKVLDFEFIKNDIEITNKIKSDVLIEGPRNVFERVLINILVNSIQALKSKDYSKKVVLSERITNSCIAIVIEDNGVGVNTSDLQSIFRIGFTTKPLSLHSGIGLGFSKIIIKKKFHGNIQIESKKGQYTRILLRLPIK